eukprot:gene762-1235_t
MGVPKTSVSFSISTDGGKYFTLGGSYYYHEPLSVQSTLPSEGTLQGGTAVTVTLENSDLFSATYNISKVNTPAACKFDRVVVNAHFVPPSTILCNSPPTDAGVADLSVSLNGQDYSQKTQFTYLYSVSEITGGFIDTPQIETKLTGEYVTEVDFYTNPFYQTENIFFYQPFYQQYQDATLCLVASTPQTGPKTGGTDVLLKLSGRVPDNHQYRDFWCRFGGTYSYTTVRAKAFYYDGDDPIVVCTSSPGSGDVEVKWSFDNVHYSEYGAPFKYHDNLYLRGVEPGHSETSDAISVRVDLEGSGYSYSPAPTDAVISTSARCRFGDVEVPATYYSADSLRNWPRIVCDATAKEFGNVSLSVALDGQNYMEDMEDWSYGRLRFDFRDPRTHPDVPDPVITEHTRVNDEFYGAIDYYDTFYFYGPYYDFAVEGVTFPTVTFTTTYTALDDVDALCLEYALFLPSDSDLTSLTAATASGAELQVALSPRFERKMLTYYAEEYITNSPVTITAVPSMGPAKIRINGGSYQTGYEGIEVWNAVNWTATSAVSLTCCGTNAIEIEVVSPGGVTKSYYTININVLGDTRLSALELLLHSFPAKIQNFGLLSPTFASSTRVYDITVEPSVGYISFQATLTDPSATLEVPTFSGAPASSGVMSDPVRIYTESNAIQIGVATIYGVTEYYTINVYRGSTGTGVTTLQGITVNNGATPLHQLNSNNHSVGTGYTASVRNYFLWVSGGSDISTDALTLTGTCPSQPSTTDVYYCITYSGWQQVATITPTPLAYGNNTVILEVIASDFVTTDYIVVTVYRSDSTVKDLRLVKSNIAPYPIATSYAFEYNKFDYDLTVGDDDYQIYLNVITFQTSGDSGVVTLTFSGVNATGDKCASETYFQTLTDGSQLYGPITLDYLQCRTSTLTVTSRGSTEVPPSESIYTLVVTRSMGGETTLAALDAYAQVRTTSVTGYTYNVPLIFDSTFYSNSFSLDVGTISSEAEYVTLDFTLTNTLASYAVSIKTGSTAIACTTTADAGYATSFAGTIACPIGNPPIQSSILFTVTSQDGQRSEEYTIKLKKQASENRELASAVFHSTYTYGTGYFPAEQHCTFNCSGCTLTCTVQKETEQVQMASNGFGYGSTSVWSQSSPYLIGQTAATYPSQKSQIIAVDIGVTYEQSIVVTSQSGTKTSTNTLRFSRALGANTTLRAESFFSAVSNGTQSGIVVVDGFGAYSTEAPYVFETFFSTVYMYMGALDSDASIAAEVCKYDENSKIVSDCVPYSVSNDVARSTQLELHNNYVAIEITVVAENGVDTSKYRVLATVINSLASLSDMILSTGLAKTTFVSNHDMSGCDMKLHDLSAETNFVLNEDGDLVPYPYACGLFTDFNDHGCMCVEGHLSEMEGLIPLFTENCEAVSADTLLMHEMCLSDISGCEGLECTLTAYVPPLSTKVDVMIYGDATSSIAVTLDDVTVSKQSCAPRLAGPFADETKVVGAGRRYGVVEDCYLMTLGAVGTSKTMLVTVSSTDSTVTRTYTLSVTRETEDAMIGCYAMEHLANGTAGYHFEATYIDVDYPLWVSKYGNDTMYNEDGSVALLGNEFGISTLSPPSFTPYWYLVNDITVGDVGNASIAVAATMDSSAHPPYRFEQFYGEVGLKLTRSGDYLMSMTPDGSDMTPAYREGGFSVQPTSMDFSLSVVQAPVNALGNGMASFDIEARDIYDNPMGSDPHHGYWSLAEEEYLSAVYIHVDVCGGTAETNETAFWDSVYGFAAERRRALLQSTTDSAPDATLEECMDMVTLPVWEQEGLQADDHFCAVYEPFANRGCFCYEDIRSELVRLYGPDYVARLNELSHGCGIPSVQCVSETTFCPVMDLNAEVAFSVATGLYTASYTTTKPGTYSITVAAGSYYAPAGAGDRRLLAAEVPYKTYAANSPTDHSARPGEPKASASLLLSPQSPQQAAEQSAMLEVQITDKYGNPMYTGGDAFYLIPKTVTSPDGSQVTDGYTTPHSAMDGMYDAAYGDANTRTLTAYYNGSAVVDMFTGTYQVYTPSTVPGLYTINLFASVDACDYRTYEEELAVAVGANVSYDGEVCGIERIGTGTIEIIPADMSYLSLFTPQCDFEDCEVYLLDSHTFTVQAVDRFGNDLQNGGEWRQLSLSVSEATGQLRCLEDPYRIIDWPTQIPNYDCIMKLDAAVTSCGDESSSLEQCCSAIAQMWVTYADDGNLCICSPEVRVESDLLVLLQWYESICVGTVQQCDNLDGDGNLLLGRKLTAATGGPPRRRLLQEFAHCPSYPVEVTDLHNGQYTVTFTMPVQPQEYRIQLVVNGTLTMQDLVAQVGQGVVNATMSTFTVESRFLPGEAVVYVQGNDEYGQPAVGGEQLIVALLDSKTYNAVEECEMAGCGVYTISFADKVTVGVDKFFLFVVNGDYQEEFGQGQYTIIAAAASVASTVESMSSTYTAGAHSAFMVQARDTFNNPLSLGGDTFKVEIIPDGAATLIGLVTDQQSGQYQVTFETLQQPNVEYEVYVYLQTETVRFTYALDGTGNTVQTAVTEYGWDVLDSMPRRFIAVSGNVVADCYKVSGGITEKPMIEAKSNNLYVSIYFVPGGECGNSPSQVETFTMWWQSAADSSQVAASLYCDGDFFNSDGSQCTVRHTEFNAGMYHLRLELDSVLIGCSDDYYNCANPYEVQVYSSVPVADRSVLTLPATYRLVAGTPTDYEFDITIVLRDTYGNAVSPLTQLESKWYGPEVVFTSSVTDPIYADVEFTGRAGEYKARSEDLLTAGIYSITTSFYLVDTSSTIVIEPQHNQGTSQLEVEPSLPDPNFFLFSGSGTTDFATADDELAVWVDLRDSYGNAVLASDVLDLVTINSIFNVEGTTVELQGYNQLELRGEVVGDHMEVRFNITKTGTYNVRYAYAEVQYEYYYSSPINVVAGAVVIMNTQVYSLPAYAQAGAPMQFKMLLRDRYDNGASALSQEYELIMSDSSLVGAATGNTVPGTAMRMRSAGDGDAAYAVEFTTSAVDTYQVRLVINAVAVDHKPTFAVHAQAAAVAETRVDASALTGAVAGQRLTVAVYPRDRYGNERTEADDDISVELYLTQSTGETVVQPARINDFIDGTGEYRIIYEPTVTGSAQLFVRVNTFEGVNNVAPGAPFDGQIVAGPIHQDYCQMHGSGLRGAVKNVPGRFQITAKDAYGNTNLEGGAAFLVQVLEYTGGSDVTSVAEEILDGKHTGKYLVEYTISTKGSYTMTVDLIVAPGVYESLGNAAILDGTGSYSSPISDLRVEHGNSDFDETRCTVSTDGSEMTHGYAASPNTFHLQTYDANGIPLAAGGLVFAVKLDGREVETDEAGSFSTAVDHEDGTYTLTYQVVHAGTFALTVTTLLGEEGNKVEVVVGPSGLFPMTTKISPAPTSMDDTSLDDTRLTGFSAAHRGESLDGRLEVRVGETFSVGISSFDAYQNLQEYGEWYPTDYFQSFAVEKDTGLFQMVQSVLEQHESGSYYNVVGNLTVRGHFDIVVLLSTSAISQGQYISSKVQFDFHVIAGPIDFSQAYAYGPGLAGSVAGVPGNMSVVAKDIYSNLIPASQMLCEAKLDHSTYLVCADAGDRFDVSYLLQRKGEYRVSLRIGDTEEGMQDVTDSRQLLTIVAEPVAVPEQSVALSNTQQGVFVTQAGDEALITVQSKDQYSNLLDTGGYLFFGNIVGDNAARIPLDFSEHLSGTYYATYTMTVSGEYDIEITLGNEPIFGSPYALTVSPASTDPSLSFVTLEGSSTALSDEVTLIADQPVSLLIYTFDRFGNPQVDGQGRLSKEDSFFLQLLATVEVEDEELVPVFSNVFADVANGRYELSVTGYSVNGKYQLVIQLAEGYYHHLQGTPLDLHVKSGTPRMTYSTSSDVEPVDYPTDAPVDKLYNYFRLTLRDQFSNVVTYDPMVYIDVQLTAEGDPAVPVEVIKQRQSDPVTREPTNVFYFTVASTWAGFYQLDFLVNGQRPTNLIENPYVSAGPAEVTMSRAYGTGVGGVAAVAGAEAHYKVLGRDRFGNDQVFTESFVEAYTFVPKYEVRVGSNISFVSNTSEGAFITSVGSTGLNNAGEVDFMYTCTKAGALAVHLTAVDADFNIVYLLDSPFLGEVAPAEVDKYRTLIHGPGATAAHSHQPADVHVSFFDSFGNPTTEPCTDSWALLTPADYVEWTNRVEYDHCVKTFTASLPYSIEEEYDYGLHVYLYGQEVGEYDRARGIVVTVKRTMLEIDAAKSILLGEGLEGTLQAGAEATFKLTLLDRAGAMSNSLKGDVTVEDADNATGTTEEDVPSSPPPDDSSSPPPVADETLASPPQQNRPPSVSSSDALVIDMNDGSYTVTYSVGVSEPSTAAVYVDGALAAQLEVSVQPGPTDAAASEISIASGVVTHVASSVLPVSVTPRDAHGNRQDYTLVSLDTFTLEVVGPQYPEGEVTSMPLVHDEASDTYNAYVTLDLVGTYTLRALLGGDAAQVVTGAAHEVVITRGAVDPSRCRVYGTGTELAFAGATTFIYVMLKDAGGNVVEDPAEYKAILPSVSGEALNQDDVEYAPSIEFTFSEQDGVGSLRGAYLATLSGFYDLVVKFTGSSAANLYVHDTHVLPADLNVPKSSADVPERAVVGDVVFDIFARDLYGNVKTSGDDTFKVTAHGPVMLNAADITPDVASAAYTVTLAITVAGAYTVSVESAGETFGTEFPISVDPGPTSVANTEVVGLSSFVVGEIVTAMVTARDAFGNQKTTQLDAFKITYSIVGGEAGPQDPAMVGTGPGTYIKEFVPMTSTTHGLTVTIKLGDERVFHNSSLMVLPAAMSPAATEAKPVPSEVVPQAFITSVSSQVEAGGMYVMDLLVKDAFGNPASGNGSAFILTVDDGLSGEYPGSGEHVARVKTEGDPTMFTASFTLTVASNYMLTISANGVRFYGSKDNLVVVSAAPDLGMTVVQFASNYTAMLTGQFEMTLRDRHGNAVKERKVMDQEGLGVTTFRIVSVTSDQQVVTVTRVQELPDHISSGDVTFDDTTGLYTVQVTPFYVGTFSLGFSLGGVEQLAPEGIPFIAAVDAGPAVPTECLVAGAGAEAGGIVGSPAVFYIQAKDQFQYNLTGEAGAAFTTQFSRDAVNPADVVVEYTATGGLYKVTYTPLVAGYVNLWVYYDGEYIKSTPTSQEPKSLLFTVESDEPIGSASQLLAPEGYPARGVLRGLALGLAHSFEVQLADTNSVPMPQSKEADYSSRIVVESRPEPTLLGAVRKDVDGQRYTFDFTAEVAGEYFLSVYLESTDVQGVTTREEVRGSGLEVAMAPGNTAPTASEAKMRHGIEDLQGVPLNGLVGQEVYIYVQSKDFYGNDQVYHSEQNRDPWTVALYQQSVKVEGVRVRLEDLGTGVYHVIFAYDRIGSFDADITLYGVSVATVAVTIAGAHLDAGRSVLTPGPEMTMAGHTYSFQIDTVDVYGNAMASYQTPMDVTGTGLEKVTGAVEELEGSVFRGNITFTVAGQYLVAVHTSAGQIGGSNAEIPVVVTPAEVDVAKSSAHGGGLTAVEVAKTAIFTIVPRDRFGNLVLEVGRIYMSPFVEREVVVTESGIDVTYVPSDWRIQDSQYLITLGYNGEDIGTYMAKVFPAAAPKLASAVLEDTLTRLRITFDMVTNNADMGNSTDCTQVLTQECVDILGESPACTFVPTNATYSYSETLLVTLGARATILPAGTTTPSYIAVKPEALGTPGGYSYNATGRVLVQAPMAAVPRVSISAPRVVGVCEELVLDARGTTGHGGRNLTYTYMVQSATDGHQLDALVEQLSEPSQDPVLTIARDALVPGAEYVFTLTATNFLELSGSTTLTVTKATYALPTVSILGPQVQDVDRASDVVVTGVVHLGGSHVFSAALGRCVSNTGEAQAAIPEVNLTWTTMVAPSTEGSLAVHAELGWTTPAMAAYNGSAYGAVLTIPAGRLRSGRTYRVVLTGAPNGEEERAASAHTELVVGTGPVQVRVLGGSRRVHDNQTVVVEALVHDPQASVDAAGSEYQFQYTWSLTAAEGNGYVTPSAWEATFKEPSAENAFGQKLVLEPGALLPGSYEVTVRAERGPLLQPVRGSEYATAVLTVASAETTAVQIIPVNDPARLALLGPADTTKELKFLCQVEGDPLAHTYEWSVEGSNGATLTALAPAYNTTKPSSMLVVAPGRLAPAQHYMVRCAARRGVATGEAEVTLTAETFASSGRLSVSSRNAVAGEVVTLEVVDFVGPANGNLMYEYRYIRNGNGVELLLAERTSASYLQALFPHGTITPLVYITQITNHGSSMASTEQDLPAGLRMVFQDVAVQDYSGVVLQAHRTRRLSQTFQAETAGMLKAATFDPEYKAGDVFGALMAATVFGAEFGDAEGDDTCRDGDGVHMAALKSELAAQLYALDGAAAVSNAYIEQSACAVAAVAREPSELLPSAANAFVQMMYDKAEFMTKEGRQSPFTVPAVPGTDPFECPLDAVDLSLRALHLNCSGASNQTVEGIYQDAVNTLLQLSSSISYRMDPGDAPRTYNKNTFSMTVLSSQGSLAGSAGDVSFTVALPLLSELTPMTGMITTIYIDMMYWTDDNVAGSPAAVFIEPVSAQGGGAVGTIKFVNTPSIPAGKSLGIRFISLAGTGSNGEIQQLNGEYFDPEEIVPRELESLRDT